MFNYLKYFIIAMVIVKVAGAATITCEFSKGWDRPVSPAAKAIAARCKAKTCNGQCFADYVKKSGSAMPKLKRNSGKASEADFLKSLK